MAVSTPEPDEILVPVGGRPQHVVIVGGVEDEPLFRRQLLQKAQQRHGVPSTGDSAQHHASGRGEHILFPAEIPGFGQGRREDVPLRRHCSSSFFFSCSASHLRYRPSAQ